MEGAGPTPDAAGAVDGGPASAPRADEPSLPGRTPLSLGDLVFCVVFVGIMITSKGSMLDDPGLGWHIRNVDAMIEQGHWLTTDPFSATHADWRWYANQWVGDVLLWLGDRWGGLNGIAVVTTMCLAVTYLTLYHMLRADGLAAPVAFGWTIFGAMGSYFAWTARPNFLTLWFLLLTVRGCELFHRGRASPRSLLWLIPLFALWANSHGGFLAGLLSLGVTLAAEAGLAVGAAEPAARRAAVGRARWLSLVLGACFLATLVNPYGWRLYPWVFELLGNRFFMDECNIEWFSPDFHKPGAMRFELLLLLFPVLMAYTRARPTLVELALGVFWLHFALNGRRYVPLWAVVMTPTLARASAEVPWLRRVWEKVSLSDDLAAIISRPPGRPGWTVPVVVALAALGWARFGGPFAAHSPANIPTAALDTLLKIHPTTDHDLVFHSPDWGGYLIWRGWPAFKPYIDDRNEVQGEAFIREYFAVLSTKPGWQEKVKDIRTVCIPADTPLSYALEQDPGWRRVYPPPRKGVAWAAEAPEAPAAIFQRTEEAVAGR